MKPGDAATAITLRAGVAVSFVLLCLGIALSFAKVPTTDFLSPGQLRQDISDLTWPDIPMSGPMSGGLRGQTAALLHLGLLMLMFTPIARVMVLLVEFLKSREFSFALISIGVLFLLSLSILIGLMQEPL